MSHVTLNPQINTPQVQTLQPSETIPLAPP